MILHTRNAGFTLIEAVIVLSIFVFLSSISWLSLSSYVASSGLDQAANQVIALLNDAQSRSVVQEQGSTWGVSFINGATSDSFVLLKGGTVYGAPRFLRGNVVFIDPGSLESKSVIFEKLTGSPSDIFTVTLGVSGRTITRVIEIDEFGGLTGLGTGQYRGLVGYWKFDEVEGDGVSTTTPDLIGGNDGTVEGGAVLDDGIKNNAMSFDGSDDYVEVGNDASLDITNALTVSAWVKRSSATNYGHVVVRPTSDDAWNPPEISYGLEYSGVSDDIALVLGYSDDTLNYTTATTPGDNVWFYVVGTYDGVNRKIYINGVEEDSVAETKTLKATTADLYIGIENTIGAYPFNGLIDEVRLYNRSLSSSEISNIFYRDSLRYNGLVGFWKFNEGTSTIAYDSSSEGNNGTLTNDPTWVIGRSGNAVRFDGVDDYVNVGDVDTCEGFDDCSISAWVKLNSLSGSGNCNGGPCQMIVFNFDQSYMLNVLDSGLLESAWTGDWGSLNNDTPLTVGPWYHVVVTKDDGEITYYVNGSLDGTIVSTATTIGAASSLEIGAGNGANNPFNGSIDELRIYNRALSAGEAAYLHTHPSGSEIVVKATVTRGGGGGSYTDKTTGKTAGGTFTHTGSPNLLIDDDLGTSNADPVGSHVGTTFSVDFGSAVAIRRLTISKDTTYGYTSETTENFDYSDNGTDWTTVSSFTIHAGQNGTPEVYDFPASGAHRYWRFITTATTGGNAWLREIQMMSLQ